MKVIDYSDRGISMRIERLGQLRTLCVELKNAAKNKTPEPKPGRSR